MRNNKIVFVLCSLSFLIICPLIYACTEFRVTAKDKTIVIGRSMEWGDDMHARIVIQPRGKEFISSAPNNAKGLQWKSPYGFLYIDAYGLDVGVDGVNEKGLSIGALFFPGFGEFQHVPEGKQSQALSHLDLVCWVLSNFSTVDQVRQALADVYVWAAPIDLPQEKNAIMPCHYGVYDASGKGIVIEYTKVGLKVFDNEVGVLTNSPTFDWHVTNLRNYVGLSSLPATPMKIGDIAVSSIGQGSGLRGIPGDPTPPSRFVRVATMVNLADPADSAPEAVTLASHILNTVDVPVGAVQDVVQNVRLKDHAQWVVIKDLSNKHLYFRTYKNSTLRKIDLTEIDFSSHAKKVVLPIEEGAPVFIDITDKLKAQNPKK